MLGVTQPQVSALMRGRWEGVSLDKLFRLLKALDTDISTIVLRGVSWL